VDTFVTHRGRIAVLDWTDVNTDLIIPARYLKRIERTGYGPLLFADRRYETGGAPPIDKPEAHGPDAADFPLNQPGLKGASILVVGRNFGCGSSREHAVWAIAQAGFRALIAPGKDEGFADIFEGNAYQNGLLPIELPENQWSQIAAAGKATAGVEASIDLRSRTLTLHRGDLPDTTSFQFDVPEVLRRRLLNGLDSIAETLLYEAEIGNHELNTPRWIIPASKE
jgi:3-isopropylmalate/(R)-2-methylmalate dehydratase small subunit